MSASYYIEAECRVLRLAGYMRALLNAELSRLSENDELPDYREAARRELLRRKIWGQS